MVLLPPLCGSFNDTSSTTKARNAEVITVKNTELIAPYFKLLSPHSLITDQMRKKKKIGGFKVSPVLSGDGTTARFRKAAF